MSTQDTQRLYLALDEGAFVEETPTRTFVKVTDSVRFRRWLGRNWKWPNTWLCNKPPT